MTRSITGFCFVTVLIGSIILGQYTFMALFCIVTGLMLAELYRLLNTHHNTSVNIAWNVFGGIALFTSFALYNSQLAERSIFILYLVYLLGLFISELYRKKEDPIKNLAYAVFGQLYIALPFSLLNLIGFHLVRGNLQYDPFLVLALFMIIWMNDSGAFIVGSLIGKKRLFERISPKKSWEGFFGGMIFSLGGAFIFSIYNQSLTLPEWLLMGMIISGFSTWGDLTESLFKRTIGVKDSGSILPGHGGFLDRFDSVLLSCPAVVIYLMLLSYL